MPIKLTLSKKIYLVLLVLSAVAGAYSGYTWAAGMDDAKAVAALDTRYQAAVKASDAAAMDAILDDRFALVTGAGRATPRKTCSTPPATRRPSISIRRKRLAAKPFACSAILPS